MKCTLKISFPNKKNAKHALEILKKTQNTTINRRAHSTYSQEEKTLKIQVNASDFTALRAITTSLLRDLKIIIDTKKVIEEN